MKSKFTFTLPNNKTLDIKKYIEPLRISENDVVIVCGTLIENIGNEFSDIDVYIITEHYRTSNNIDISSYFRVISTNKEIIKEKSEEDILLVHLPVEETGVKIDIEFKKFNDIDKLSDTLNEYYHYAINNHILLTKEMSERNLSFIHRIHNGICIHNEERLTSLKNKLNQNIFNYYLYRLNASDYADLLDIIGAWRKGELERCFDLARENLIKQMLAYVCLIGNTDYKRKWILTRIKQFKVQKILADNFCELFLVSDNKTLKEYIIDTLDCVDEIYYLSSIFFRDNVNTAFPSAESVIAWLKTERNKVTKPYEIMEIEYRARAYLVENNWSTKELLDRVYE
ncbi:hypothetical protein [Serratia oryzae]|uniref:Uncharacterized protein n=1 Tax=Serratia oryzae TaxID=2034155 RepID=A0A1S8CFV5_9GAMM|nr:hypothetical protein [Serratia oryzae]OMQ20871.1 hypothetical protein BMI79_17315 [Serratia oryzae]